MSVPFQKALLGGALLAAILAAPPAAAKDVYKGSLDPSIPHHAAILDTLSRIEKDPADAKLHNDLGCLVAWDGFWRDALRSFDTAAELDPKDTRPWFNAGLVQGLRGEWGGARSRFKKAVKVDPGNWPAWWMLGFSEERLGNDNAAVAAYSRSLRVDTSLFDPKVNPFAVATRLKSRVLLETYDRRRVDAALPFANQISSPSRVAAFFQPAVKTAAPPAPTVETRTGPVVTSVPPPGPPSSAAPSAAPSVTEPSGRRRRPYAGREREAPIEVAPEPVREAPAPDPATQAAPKAPEAGAGDAAKEQPAEPPGPGMPVTRRVRTAPAPVPTRPPDPE